MLSFPFSIVGGSVHSIRKNRFAGRKISARQTVKKKQFKRYQNYLKIVRGIHFDTVYNNFKMQMRTIGLACGAHTAYLLSAGHSLAHTD